MRITLNLKDDILTKAIKLTGIKEKNQFCK
ncbi:hypothetical protein BMS3Abin03_00977 [bacterium BMS3Abin03]|nr:hypothetical protein BMS3Abin03_00977 [bacterium BMS3Abin03]